MSAESEFKDMTVQLTELGAIIINSDGTMSKVENWKELTSAEQAKTLRVIAKRNTRRKAALEAQEVQEVQQNGEIDKAVESKDEEVLAIEDS